MKFFHNIYIAFLCLILSISIFIISVYYYCLSSPSSNSNLETIEIKPGSIDSIGTTLEKEGFIRNKTAFKIYIKITQKSNLKAGTYSLSKDMGVIEIVNILEKGNNYNAKEVQILFKEGLNMRQIAQVIEKNTNNKEEMVYKTLEDKEYLNSLIDKYWFLTEEILNNNIYYALEGYLYPNTYSFKSKDVSIKEIFTTMLNETEKQLEKHKENIKNNKFSVHEILTLASIVELEGVTSEDRKGIASVFYNRLNNKMNLGSDVTTYYGLKINVGDIDDDKLDLNGCNNYNTRCATYKKLPIGPICNPSIDSINAALNPSNSTNLYFLADKNGKIYFSKTNKEHINTKNKLIKDGLWN